MTKFKGRYRIGSHRKPYWNYSAEGYYFLTIVTQNRVCNLGKIVNNKMILSDFGIIVKEEFIKSFEIRKELFLDEYVIMPNHLHLLVEIRNVHSPSFSGSDSGSFSRVEPHGRAALHTKTQIHTKLEPNTKPESPTPTKIPASPIQYHELTSIKRNMPFRLPKSISSFVAGFKSAVNTQIDNYIDEHQLSIPKYNRRNHFFQPNYHDHVIRNAVEYRLIKEYIIQNPNNWRDDQLKQ